MRTGIVLPTFRDTPDEAFAVAHEAVAAGVDGVFCYDHIWPIGQPERPALAPFPDPRCARGAARRPSGDGRRRPVPRARWSPGSVSRPDAVLASQFVALEHLAPGRVIAGLGTGDRLSEEENRAYGIPFGSAAERRAEMVDARAVSSSTPD